MNSEEWFEKVTVGRSKRKLFFFTVLTLYILLAIGLGIGGYYFIQAFKHTPKSQVLTQTQIIDTTGFDAKDTPFLRSLKSNALQDYLTSGNTQKIIALSKNESIINSIIDGKLLTSQLDKSLEILAQEYGASKTDVATLKNQYYISRLESDTAKLQKSFSTVKITDTSNMFNQTNNLISEAQQVSEIYLKSSTSNNELLESINKAIDLVTEVVNQSNQILELKTAVKNPNETAEKLSQITLSSPFASQLSPTLTGFSVFLTKNEQAKQLLLQIQTLQKQIDGAVNIPNVVGMQLKDAKNTLNDYNQKNKSQLTFKLDENSDSTNTAVITAQTPNQSSYDLVAKNAVIKIQTAPKVETSSSSSKEKTTGSSSSDRKSNNNNNGWSTTTNQSSSSSVAQDDNGWKSIQ